MSQNGDRLDEATVDETADVAEERAAWPRRAGWVAALLVAFAILNAGITFVFEHYGCSAELTWTQYRMVEPGELDSVIIGTSVALQAFDPYVLDENMDSSTFNFAFYGLTHRFARAGLEEVMGSHPIKRVYFGLSPDSMTAGEYDPASVMFTQYKMRGESLPEKLHDLSRVLLGTRFGSTASLEMFFPWSINNRGNDLDAIAENVHNRLTYSIAELADGSLDGTDTSKGFRPFEEHVLDADAASAGVEVPPAEAEQLFAQDKYEEVGRIARLCKEAGAELYVVVMPQPTFEVLAMGESYLANWARVREVVEEAGGTFIDMNLVKAETYKFADDEFCDTQHLNAAGAQRFSAFFAQLVERIEAGEDVLAEGFYSYGQWDEYLASIDGVQLVNFTCETVGDAMSVDAHLYAGPQTQAEFELQGLDEGTGEYVTIVPYGSDSHFELAAEDLPHTLRVCAREIGSSASYDHCCVREVTAG